VVRVGRAEERRCEYTSSEELIVGVPDGWMSRSHVKLERVMGNWLFEDLGSSNGTRLNGEYAQHGALRDGDVLEIGRTFFAFRAGIPTDAEGPTALSFSGLDSLRPDLLTAYQKLARVAASSLEVLLFGESGAGKEVVARAVHELSGRTGEFVAVNCGAVAKDLLEAELFGVERGVATGVEARPGKFESADSGTLFLDEIGDMAPETQAKILRVLQEGEVFRLGGHTPRPARARVIAATNRPIHTMITEGTFRSDLFHRIATWEVELPPLRRRRGDIPNLAVFLLAREAQRLGVHVRGISRAALKLLQRYRWPGNIRQLKNEISRAVLFLEDGELLDTSRLSAGIRGATEAYGGGSLTEILETVEREEISAALDATGGDTQLAAERLKMSRPTLYRRIKSLGIRTARA
jgi:transcriptional regulator with PAS, ATPase and Fis domain